VCAEFQTQSSARIQLSRTTELFPGTNDRIMLISGTVNQVLTALHLVLAKMSGEKLVLETMLARCARRGATAWASVGVRVAHMAIPGLATHSSPEPPSPRR
jgi:hypothetical protein